MKEIRRKWEGGEGDKRKRGNGRKGEEEEEERRGRRKRGENEREGNQGEARKPRGDALKMAIENGEREKRNEGLRTATRNKTKRMQASKLPLARGLLQPYKKSIKKGGLTGSLQQYPQWTAQKQAASPTGANLNVTRTTSLKRHRRKERSPFPPSTDYSS